MIKRIPLSIIMMSLSGIASAQSTLYDNCDANDISTHLNEEQLNYLYAEWGQTQQTLNVKLPTGGLPIIQRCDVDRDRVVDINDIRAIAGARNQPAKHPLDPMDFDRNGIVDVVDARGCQLRCALARCAVPTASQIAAWEADGSRGSGVRGGQIDKPECFQKADFDGDGQADDIAFLSERTSERSSDWRLELVFLHTDAAGNISHTRYPNSGIKVKDERFGSLIEQHLALQPAGVVELHPGSITIPYLGIVSYVNEEPHTLYFYDEQGRIRRASYGVDD